MMRSPQHHFNGDESDHENNKEDKTYRSPPSKSNDSLEDEQNIFTSMTRSPKRHFNGDGLDEDT